LAVTTATDFGVFTPTMAAAAGGAGAFAAEPRPPQPDNDPAASRLNSAHVKIFKNDLPIEMSRTAPHRPFSDYACIGFYRPESAFLNVT